MLDEGVEQDAGQNLASKAKERNTLVIRLAIALSFGLCWHLLAVVGPFLHCT